MVVGVIAGMWVFSLSVACTTPAVKEAKLCTPNQLVFCRCQDRAQGQKQCSEDGQSFGRCEPCERWDNPEGPLEPGDPDPSRPYTPDAGTGADSGPVDPVVGCGNGAVENGEDCDDKNANDDDGCDKNCKLAGVTPPLSSGCPGLPVHVWGGAHKPTLVAKTPGAGNRSVTPTCSDTTRPTSGVTAPDRVFQVVAHASGTLRVAITSASYDVFLYASDKCAASANTFLACANATDGVGNEDVSVAVESGKTYYVFVDGTGSAPSTREGDFRVTFSID